MWILFLAFIPLAIAVDDHGHDANDLHKCTLCPCFVKYEDRDIWVPKKPYAAIKYTEDDRGNLDRCLKTCGDDGNCEGIVFGIVGGRYIYTCEFYDGIDPMMSPRYTPYVDVYLKRKSMPCMIDSKAISKYSPTKSGDEIDDAVARKERYARLYSQPNPFYVGRK